MVKMYRDEQFEGDSLWDWVNIEDDETSHQIHDPYRRGEHRAIRALRKHPQLSAKALAKIVDTTFELKRPVVVVPGGYAVDAILYPKSAEKAEEILAQNEAYLPTSTLARLRAEGLPKGEVDFNA